MLLELSFIVLSWRFPHSLFTALADSIPRNIKPFLMTLLQVSVISGASLPSVFDDSDDYMRDERPAITGNAS